MKTFKKILMVICVIIIAVGMFMLGRQGFNYADGYSQDVLIETAMEYAIYVGISTAVILIYLVIRYSKQGVFKVAITSILGIVGAIALVIAIIAIIRMPISRLFFSIMLITYVSSLIVLSSSFEENA